MASSATERRGDYRELSPPSLARRPGMTVMPAYRFFDPWAELEHPGRPSATGKVAKSDAAAPQSLASLAGLAALPVPFSDRSAKNDELPEAGADRSEEHT